jgi:hypothetical protein
MAFRCNGQLVYEGDTQDIVIQKCGEPEGKKVMSTSQALYNDAGVRYGSTPYLTEVWTYQSTPQDFVYKVYFTNKKVTSISSNLPTP